MADVMAELVKNVAETSYEDIPADTVGIVKNCVMNSLAAALAGTSFPGAREIAEQFRHWGGNEESTVLGFGFKLPARSAVVPNCYMARAWDYEEIDERTAFHPTPAVVPAAFAMAERIGRVSGKEFIAAVTLGMDLMLRMVLGRDTYKSRGDMPAGSVTYAPFAVVATVSKLLGSTKEQMLNAMGIAGTHLPVIKSGRAGAYMALTKNLGFGMGAETGITAVLLGHAGVTGPLEPLEGPLGFYSVYERGRFNREKITGELGRKFELDTICLKAYPCFGQTIPSLFTAIELVKEHDIDPDEVTEVVAYVDHSAYSEVCEPLAERQQPENIVAAQWSLPYVVATGIVTRNVGLGDFTEAAIRDARRLRVAKLIKPLVDPDLDAMPKNLVPGKIRIKTRDGRVFQGAQQFYKGHPGNPLTSQELVHKFKECADHGVKSIPPGQVEEAIGMLLELERLDDMAGIIRLL